MSKIHEHRFLNCPYNRARELLAQAVADAVETGSGRTVRLTLPITGGEISKDVVVDVKRGVDPTHFHQPWILHWEPIGGLYPSFDGTLTVEGADTYETSRLALDGSYTPPGGAPGAAFDAVIGTKLAAATAQELLRKIGDALEQRYRAEEAAKTGAADS